MNRLVVFGCSHTFGHGLPDCHKPPEEPGETYSKLAWPSHLSNLLNLELVNTSHCGASNLQILWKFLNFPFKETDICVIMWTHFDRHIKNNVYLDCKQGHFSVSKIDWAQYNDENVRVRNFISIHHAALRLREKNIKSYFVLPTYPEFTYEFPEIIKKDLPKLLNVTLNSVKIDLALDKKHMGEKSHRLTANLLFNEIKADL